MRQHKTLLMFGAMAIVAMAFAATAPAAETPEGADRPAHLEKVEGSDIPRVVLTEQAAKRLSIATEAVREKEAKRWTLLSGQVEQVAAPSESSDGITTASISEPAPVRIKVPANGAEEQPAQQILLTLAAETDDEDGGGLLDEIAEYFGGGDKNDQDDDNVAIVTMTGTNATSSQYRARPIKNGNEAGATGQYFEVIGPAGGLAPGQPVFVGFAAPDSGKQAKVVPYSAVIYDAEGGSWLYTNPEPLVFVRHKIMIERVLGDLAILSDGPSAGTKVVSVGSAELMGVEQKIGH